MITFTDINTKTLNENIISTNNNDENINPTFKELSKNIISNDRINQNTNTKNIKTLLESVVKEGFNNPHMISNAYMAVSFFLLY